MSENKTAWLITSLTATEASPKALLTYNRDHWRIENNLHRNKDVTLGEDAYTNRKDQAPRNIFTLNAIVLELAASFGLSPKIESLPVFGQGGRAPPRSATRGRVGFLGASPGKTIDFAKQVKLLRVNVTDLDRQIEALDAARSAAPETAGIIKTVAAAGKPKLAANVMNTVMSGERAEAKARSGQRAERRRRRRFGRLTGTDRRFAWARSRTHTKLKDQPPITN